LEPVEEIPQRGDAIRHICDGRDCASHPLAEVLDDLKLSEAMVEEDNGAVVIAVTDDSPQSLVERSVRLLGVPLLSRKRHHWGILWGPSPGLVLMGLLQADDNILHVRVGDTHNHHRPSRLVLDRSSTSSSLVSPSV